MTDYLNRFYTNLSTRFHWRALEHRGGGTVKGNSLLRP